MQKKIKKFPSFKVIVFFGTLKAPEKQGLITTKIFVVEIFLINKFYNSVSEKAALNLRYSEYVDTYPHDADPQHGSEH
jgi:hypothetical protein